MSFSKSLTVCAKLVIADSVRRHLRLAWADYDWPILATALALDLPIWTEDRDFFGCGVATWITRTVQIYLGRAEKA